LIPIKHTPTGLIVARAENAPIGYGVNWGRTDCSGLLGSSCGADQSCRSGAFRRPPRTAQGYAALQYPPRLLVSVSGFVASREPGVPLISMARERLHTRAIGINGYRRIDGHYDIETRLTGCKSFSQTNYDRRTIEAGESNLDMWL
jgi:hypothetical protein